jgi:hypothetical protein
MRRLLLLLLLLWPVLSQAQCPGVTVQLIPFAKETLTIDGSVKSLTASVYKPPGVTPSMASITVRGGSINYAVVGDPTSTDGHPVGGAPAQTLTICGIDSITAFKATRITSDADLYITYYRPK